MINSTVSSQKLKIALLGSIGFPYKIGAEISRQLLLAKGLAENDCEVLVIMRKGFRSNKEFPYKGLIEGVNFVYTNGKTRSPENFILREWDLLKGAVAEILLIRKNQIPVVILNARSFWNVMHYCILGKVFRFRVLLNYVEYNSQLRGRRRNVWKRINDILFENYIFRFLQGALPISEILAQLAVRSNPRLPYLKVPVLADFSKFVVPFEPPGEYFVFCSRASYLYLFEFVIGSFELLENFRIRLKLIVYGKRGDLDKLRDLIKSSTKSTLIDVLSELDYSELVSCYSKAIALLIPLKPILKDAARFPHKIGEYSAAGRPIITTGFGEILNYFEDGVNALVAEKYDCQLFAEKMDFVLKNPEQADYIGKQGLLTGRKYFDHVVNGKLIREFIESPILSELN